MKLKQLYLLLSILGYIIPNIFVLQTSVETGNWLLWLDPESTTAGMFGNTVSTAFIADLLLVVLVFFVWSYQQSRQAGIQRVWIFWILTLLFGLAGSFPLFLYAMELKKESAQHQGN